MKLPRIESTALADISGNVFAALIIILVLIVAAGRQRPTSIELASDRALVTRTVLTPAQMIEALAIRARPGSGISLEVTRAGISAIHNGTSDVVPLQTSAPTAVFIFDHAHYAQAAARQTAQGWIELNVPAALTSAQGHWSEGFRALIGQPLAPARFREALARLLAGGPEGGLQGSKASNAPPPSSLTITRHLPALRDALTLATILLAAALVWRIESIRFSKGA